MNLGKRLKELRKSYGLTQEKLADALSISRVNYTRYETEKARPDYETLILLADFFDVTTDYLLGRKEY